MCWIRAVWSRTMSPTIIFESLPASTHLIVISGSLLSSPESFIITHWSEGGVVEQGDMQRSSSPQPPLTDFFRCSHFPSRSQAELHTVHKNYQFNNNKDSRQKKISKYPFGWIRQDAAKTCIMASQRRYTKLWQIQQLVLYAQQKQVILILCAQSLHLSASTYLLFHLN